MGPSTKLLALLVLSLVGAQAGKNWVLLIAGSNEWPNYSAQSSVCNAYQTIKKGGISDENVVVMMFDDIANNSQNPMPGKIINRYDGPDVYAGVPKDYTGDEITKDVFLAVLRGDKAAVKKLIGRDGKVIESGPDDSVFVFYHDHGGYRIVAMPDGHPVLHAREVNDTLTEMYKEKKYKQLLFYLEACESGSMFDKILSPSINVYATTAADSTESAYMIFCDDPKMNTCLAGDYSCNWQRDLDAADREKESIEVEFQNTKANTQTSHAKEFGDRNLAKKMLDVFFGKTTSSVAANKVPPCVKKGDTPVPVSMIQMESIKARLAKAPKYSVERYELEKELAAEIKKQSETETLFLDIAKSVLKTQLSDRQLSKLIFKPPQDGLRDFDCYEDAVDILHGMCPQLHASYNPYSMSKFVSLAHACNAGGYKTVMGTIADVASRSPLCRRR